MQLHILADDFSVCKVNSLSKINFSAEYLFFSKTDQEISLVCPTNFVPTNCLARKDHWRALRIQGELDFSLVGILAKISTLLAEQNIAIFVVSTYNTDYILFAKTDLYKAQEILTASGYLFT